MALNIKNREVERLAAEVAEMTHDTKTHVIRRALEDLKGKLEAEKPPKRRDIVKYLEKYIWPYVPPEVRGKKVTKEEREEILGYGPDGV